jgi:DNA-binding transcriptional regulator LsrR (DeoR family)
MKNYEDRLLLIERTDQLIRLNATGTASQLADILGISRILVFRLLKYFKKMKSP